MASTYLTRTPSSTGNRRTFTISAWVKDMKDSSDHVIFSAGQFPTESFQFAIESSGGYYVQARTSGSDNTWLYENNRKLRDSSGYYHIVLAVDTTQATDTNRVKLYINGEQTSNWNTPNYPTQNYDYPVNEASEVQYIGANNNGSIFNGIMSHVHFCDGQALAPTVFGETDSVTGEWKINTSPSVTYGTNGFFILKDGNSVTDQSGNSNNFTVGGGTLTKTEDCPSNVFATLNPLVNYSNFSGGTLSNGNTTHSNSSGTSNKISTLGMTSGKFYAEAKYTGGGNYNGVGFCSEPFLSGAASLANSTHGASLTYTDVYNGGVAYGTYATPSTNDIIGIALDIDNGYAYFSNNGVWGNSGVPTSGATGTGGFLISRTDANSTYFFASEQNATPGTRGADWNFGNGFFGTTQISSEGTNASGIGKFEYDVPAGYTALSTKGLNL